MTQMPWLKGVGHRETDSVEMLIKIIVSNLMTSVNKKTCVIHNEKNIAICSNQPSKASGKSRSEGETE